MCKAGYVIAGGLVVLIMLVALSGDISGFVSTEWLKKLPRKPQIWGGPIGTRDIVRQGAAPY